MSRLLAKTAPGGQGETAQVRRFPTVRLTPVGAIITAAALVGLGLRLYYMYTRPGFLLSVTEYDDGPYFGSAVRLVHGILPYRDFVLVQPPGITLLMSPVAALTYLTGTPGGLAIGRVLTLLAGTAGVVLIGLLVRHRGPLAVLVASGILAIHGDAVAAAHTVLVEPWLVLFCLIGALAVFDGDRLTTNRRRLAWGGVAFGFAGAIEGWAVMPVLVILALCLPGIRRATSLRLRRAGTFIAGVAAGFIVPVLPFAIAGPHQFYQSLITAQIGARVDAVRVGVWFRMENMLGLAGITNLGKDATLFAVLAIVVAVAVIYAVTSSMLRDRPPPLDLFAAASAALIAAMFLWPPQFHYHFAGYFAPFLALVLALPLARLVQALQPWATRSGAQWWLSWPATVLAGLVIAVFALSQANSEGAPRFLIGPVPAAVQRDIPPGACVLTDQVAVTLDANRFVSNVPGCSPMVDGLGTDLALSAGLIPHTGAGHVPAVAAVWNQAFGHAQYVLLTGAWNKRIPWTKHQLDAYLDAHFVKIYSEGRKLTLYRRRGLPSGA